MLYSYERFLKSPSRQVRISQLGKPITTQEKGLSRGWLHAHMRDLRTLFNEARRKYNNGAGVAYAVESEVVYPEQEPKKLFQTII